MRILMLPKNLAIGGSQINAVDLAGSLAQQGHEVHSAAAKAPLRDRLLNLNVSHTDIPPAAMRFRRLAALRQTIRRVDPDVIHAFEVRNIIDASHVAPTVPTLGTIMSTRVPWFLPESVPVTVGSPDLFRFTQLWRGGVTLLPPPIPIEHSAQPQHRGDLAAKHGLGEVEHLFVMVSRLVEPFKREAIVRTIRSMGTLETERPVALLIVGDGVARPLFEAEAEKVNKAAGERIVVFAGELTDPTPAFEAADTIVGSGTAVMRGVALGIPSIVVGREGFSDCVDGESIEALISAGFYGVGEGVVEPDPLAAQMASSLDVPARAGTDPLRLAVAERYGAAAVGKQLEGTLTAVAADPQNRARHLTELSRSALRGVHYKARKSVLSRAAARAGLVDEEADNFVFGRLRNLALPPQAFGTGRNQPASESESAHHRPADTLQ